MGDMPMRGTAVDSAGVTMAQPLNGYADNEVNNGGVSGSPNSHSSQLSIEDLSSHGGDKTSTISGRKNTRTVAPMEESLTSFGNDTQRVESKLKLNLKQQQEHYARQRQLFEDLRNDSALAISPSAFSSSSKSDDDGHSEKKNGNEATDEASMRLRSDKFQLQLQQLQRQLTGASGGATHGHHAEKAKKRLSDASEQEDDDVDEIERLQRKARSIAEYHARAGTTLHSGGAHYSRVSVSGRASASRGRIGKTDDPYRQDSSNEALRKQLELLRRLQLENNRFRHENRSLREQNEVLEEQSALHTREIKRLKDEISELSVRVQHDQVELATAAQSMRKMKQIQKQLTVVQDEKQQLQSDLQEAMDQDQQLRLKTQGEIESVIQESKHLKRSLRQVRQHESKLAEQCEELKGFVAALENECSELKRQLLDTKRDSTDMAARLSEKTTQIEAIEGSATQCVERMEAGMEALQKAHTAEREKRKKIEKQRDALQVQMGTLEVDHHTLQERVRELEQFTSQLQQRLQDWKLEKKQDKKFQGEKIAEFLERQKSDSKTIGNLRDECATFEQQLETARASVVEVRKEVATESNALRKEVEALRNYIEDAQRAPPSSGALNSASHSSSVEASFDEIASVAAPALTRQRREDLWVQLPELQFLQGAVGGLRNEMMNFVNDFHRARHQVRQHAVKLTAAQERVVELDHLRSEDAITMKEVRDQCVLAEQAREIVSQEKLEILKWSQQTCEKNESLEGELAKGEHSLQSMMKKTKRARQLTSEDNDEEDGATNDGNTKSVCHITTGRPPVGRLLSMMEREVDELTARVGTLHDEHKTKTKESRDHQQRITRLQKELETQRQDHEAMLSDVEALHGRSLTEKQQLFTESMEALDNEKQALDKALEDERVTVATLHGHCDALQKRVQDLEQDVPVFTSLVHVFTLVVPSLVLQVNDLLMQKRVLMKENNENALALEQVECIGQVLRELVPSSVGATNTSDSYAEQQRKLRRRKFRRVVIAVFALNRFQHGGFAGSATGTGESPYGVCTSLKASKKKKKATASSLSSSSSTSCMPPQTVIKVLPGKLALARLDLRKALDRLKTMDVASKIRDVLDASSVEKTSSFGSLLVQILTTMDPASKEILIETADGGFHCRALLERRKPARRNETGGGGGGGSGTSGGCDDGGNVDARLSTVDLIRKRILAMGKRVEDLHYQRNALQKENYEFQFQLEQQAGQLKEMDVLAEKAEMLQQEIHTLTDQHVEEKNHKEELLEEKTRVLADSQHQLTKQQSQLENLENEIVKFENRIAALEVEKTELRRDVLVAQHASAEEEEKRHKSRVGMDKQAEELRNLKQAAKRAHELHQQVTWQLEQELIEKASLKAMMDHLRKQKDTLEKEVYKANVRAVDESFEAGSSSGEEEEESETDPQNKVVARKTKVNEIKSSGRRTVQTADALVSSKMEVDVAPREERRRAEPSMGRTASPVEEDDDLSYSSTDDHDQPLAFPGTRMAPKKTDDSFRHEWQRLDISGVFEDDASINRDDDDQDLTVAMDKKPSVSWRGDAHSSEMTTTATTTTTSTQRRGIEIDKVNTAVHDYMDRIDEKLQQMYGIPRSSTRSRRDPNEGNK